MSATAFICATCGTQHAPSAAPPAACAICEDPRQWVPGAGQAWTTMEALARRHAIGWREVAPDLLGCGMFPDFGIAQRALLLRTPAGNVLWDCVALVDPATVAIVKALGGIAAIAISHPHYYASMVDWARAFDCPVLLHGDDSRWVMRPDPAIRFWQGERCDVLPGVTLHRLGGHYAGGTILHWAAGRGAIMTGDIASVTPDRRHVSFMWSFPNWVPLPAADVARMGAVLDALDFDAVYGAWWDRVIPTGGKEAVRASVARYIRAVEGPGPLAP
ncbi:MBL fold metallo-hydrolase [Roseomonas sp. PWR1]|uniref:MBL fold metallo-hydrolase n=1 Tax=Roseomonas nitratireducens TaxID=2820810 RepID=A0ABS4AZN0_9PROT|nr:MBL fold metallo-hydrolase [Neoroseomonas nitratireducens]MBP0466806.1 MBL fold metallo-hydrolase [Neoroseomonas nitratireducens]